MAVEIKITVQHPSQPPDLEIAQKQHPFSSGPSLRLGVESTAFSTSMRLTPVTLLLHQGEAGKYIRFSFTVATVMKTLQCESPVGGWAGESRGKGWRPEVSVWAFGPYFCLHHLASLGQDQMRMAMTPDSPSLSEKPALGSCGCRT